MLFSQQKLMVSHPRHDFLSQLAKFFSILRIRLADESHDATWKSCFFALVLSTRWCADVDRWKDYRNLQHPGPQVLRLFCRKSLHFWNNKSDIEREWTGQANLPSLEAGTRTPIWTSLAISRDLTMNDCRSCMRKHPETVGLLLPLDGRQDHDISFSYTEYSSLISFN